MEFCELMWRVQGHGPLWAFCALNPLPEGQISICPFHPQPVLCALSWQGASLAVITEGTLTKGVAENCLLFLHLPALSFQTESARRLIFCSFQWFSSIYCAWHCESFLYWFWDVLTPPAPFPPPTPALQLPPVFLFNTLTPLSIHFFIQYL